MSETKRVTLLLEMLKNDPNDVFLIYALALEHAKEERLEEAIGLLEKAHSINESYLPAYYQLGKLYEQTGESQKAIQIYRKGIFIANSKKDMKTIGELEEALMIIDEL
ncbi:MAG: tetratricopeptide repeat protein [Bacteroidetes bacterium]|nr:tetratricopeptide repeat protein [Bacteroidota bacterium]